MIASHAFLNLNVARAPQFSHARAMDCRCFAHAPARRQQTAGTDMAIARKGVSRVHACKGFRLTLAAGILAFSVAHIPATFASESDGPVPSRSFVGNYLAGRFAAQERDKVRLERGVACDPVGVGRVFERQRVCGSPVECEDTHQVDGLPAELRFLPGRGSMRKRGVRRFRCGRAGQGQRKWCPVSPPVPARTRFDAGARRQMRSSIENHVIAASSSGLRNRRPPGKAGILRSR